MAIPVWKQISSNTFKNEITDKLISYISYLFKYVQTNVFVKFLLLHSVLIVQISETKRVLWPSSDVSRTQEPSQNFELRPLLNPWGSPVLILLAITEYKC